MAVDFLKKKNHTNETKKAQNYGVGKCHPNHFNIR